MYKRQRITYNLNAYPTQSYLSRARTYWGFRHQGSSQGRPGTRGGNAAAARIQKAFRTSIFRKMLAKKPFTQRKIEREQARRVAVKKNLPMKGWISKFL